MKTDFEHQRKFLEKVTHFRRESFKPLRGMGHLRCAKCGKRWDQHEAPCKAELFPTSK